MIFQSKGPQNEASIGFLISDKRDFKSKLVIRDMERLCILVKEKSTKMTSKFPTAMQQTQQEPKSI